MKKAVILCLAIANLFLNVACDNDDKPGSDNTETKTYLDYVLEDYQTLVNEFPDAKDHFVEARFTLDRDIASSKAQDIKVKTMEVWCYLWQERGGYSDIFVLRHDFITGQKDTINYVADSPYTGDMQIPESELKSLKTSLEQALATAKNVADTIKGGTDGLNTTNVTLRKPVYPFWDNPQYVFGGYAGRLDHFFVDAANGNATVKQSELPEGSSQAFLLEDLSMIADEYDGNQRLGFDLDVKWNLVEIQYTLNGAVNSAQASMLYPEKAIYLYYVPADASHPAYLLRGIRNSFQLGTQLEYNEEELTTPWTGGQYIHPDYIDKFFGLEEAINVVKLGNVTDTDTPDVTFCFPKEGFESPVLEFKGKNTPSVYIDAVSGEILK